METLAGSSTGALAFTLSWLGQWKTVDVVGPDRAPVVPRPAVDDVLVRPWQAKGASLANAPFRLLAIVNRPDLRSQDSGCSGAGGELRFVYTATSPDTKRAIAMTAIVEIPYPPTRTPRAWMDAWHGLAQRQFGAEYNTALAALTDEVTRDAKPETWRIRTNELAFGERDGMPWELREFALSTSSTSGRHLDQIPLATTPRIDLDGSSSLDSWAKDNESRIMDGSYVLPGGFQAGAATLVRSDFRWSSETLSSELRSSLSMATCNGCHGGERNESSLLFQHIAAPDQATGYYGTSEDGETRLSSWLNAPSGKDDELSRRQRSMARALCGTCAPPQAPNDAPPSYPR